MKSDFPLLIFCVGVMLAATLHAAVPLFDFETDAEVAALKLISKGKCTLERSPRFAITGTSSLLFTSPAWQEGQPPDWPAFEARPALTNWTGFDRLVLDVTNPHEEQTFFALNISDSKVPFDKSLAYRFELPSRGFRRFVISICDLPREVNRADIAILHFGTDQSARFYGAQLPPPKTDVALFLDNIVLLRPGESLQPPSTRFVQELKELTADALLVAEQNLARCRASASASAGVATVATIQFDQLGNYLKGLRAELDLALPSLTIERLKAINAELAAFPKRTERVLSINRLQQACKTTGLPVDNMLVGVATSMEKIFPREMPFELKSVREIEISLARNEKESFQVCVLPILRALRQVTVKVSDLKLANGATFKHEQIQCEVVGYTDTLAIYIEKQRKPPYGTPLMGWWPDPILDFLGPVDIAAGDLQAFWIRVRAPKDQPPGVYRGTLTIAAEGVAPVTLSLSARVHAFMLPDHSPLPLAITFQPMVYEEPKLDNEYPVDVWKQHKLRWVDFLADYYINYDNIYRKDPPDFEAVQRLHDRGQLVSFNLRNFDTVAHPADAGNVLAQLRATYDKAKALGALDHAYMYGFDECGEDRFPLLEKTAQTLRREFPGVLLMTTGRDPSYGQNTEVKTIDAWCPRTDSFNPDQAVKAYDAGKQVWWYICDGPHPPYANMFVESPAIESRLLMGAMTAKERPDGFLIWQISVWNSHRPITSGPFTDWNPRTWGPWTGNGSWVCVGPGGTPLPTVRLENFRDGLEDFAYVLILKDIIRQREAGGATLTAEQRQWLSEAKAALPVPASLVKAMTHYSREPAELYAWRNHLGDLIDRSGVTDANPWGKNFGVHGLPATR